MSQFIVGTGAETRVPDWMAAITERADTLTIKVKISATLLVIASILLLGEFVEISETSDVELEHHDARLKIMLIIHGALLVTAVVMAFVAWISKRSH